MKFSTQNHVLYEEMCPLEFSSRLKECPVAYLPMGTIEWHGPHLPLGADGIQSQAFFQRVASAFGGIVLPKLFLGPDRYYHDPEKDFYGMDICTGDALTSYPMHRLPGSVYWLPDALFDAMLLQIAKNLKRAGFKILAAHGHGPSNNRFFALREEIQETIGLRCISPFDVISEERLRFQNDHAAANETSITMAVRPDLVHMEYLKEENDQLAMAGRSPMRYASVSYGEELLDVNIRAMGEAIRSLLSGDTHVAETAETKRSTGS